ncbi:MAG: hypothetical protein RXO23_01010 [Vulcanisaeta sp.]
MHRSECIAVGGFKINGPPENGKGPMPNEENLKSSNEASPPKPTRAGRIETCTELISKAMKCLENNDKQCVTRKIEELIKANCHDGHAVGKEVADKVRDLVHELWLVSDNELRCELLRMLRDLGISKGWISLAARTPYQYLDKLLAKCGIEWESRARSDIVKQLEDLLRERFSWSEVRMCEEMWRFVGVDVDEFRKYGIDPCIWLKGLEELSDLRRPYWLGLARSDMSVIIEQNTLKLVTTNSIDAVFFLAVLNIIKTPSLSITWKERAPSAKYVFKSVNLIYYVRLNINAWPWPVKPDVDEFEKIIESFTDKELAEFIAGIIDGDGTVILGKSISIKIAACKNCPKRYILDVLKKIIAKRFGVIGHIEPLEDSSLIDRLSDVYLSFYDKNAVKLLRRVAKYVHHPLRRLRAELILALYDGRISREKFEELYEMTEYELGGPDVKRNNALEALARAAPQTHTHGVVFIYSRGLHQSQQ